MKNKSKFVSANTLPLIAAALLLTLYVAITTYPLFNLKDTAGATTVDVAGPIAVFVLIASMALIEWIYIDLKKTIEKHISNDFSNVSLLQSSVISEQKLSGSAHKDLQSTQSTGKT